MERIVKLTFKEGNEAQFMDAFERVKEDILASNGCRSLQLLRVQNDTRIFMTLSVWEDAQALQNYRRSEFFKHLWQEISPWFDAPAEAWSLDILHSAER